MKSQNIIGVTLWCQFIHKIKCGSHFGVNLVTKYHWDHMVVLNLSQVKLSLSWWSTSSAYITSIHVRPILFLTLIYTFKNTDKWLKDELSIHVYLKYIEISFRTLFDHEALILGIAV